MASRTTSISLPINLDSNPYVLDLREAYIPILGNASLVSLIQKPYVELCSLPTVPDCMPRARDWR
jgi:hypothetical protein